MNEKKTVLYDEAIEKRAEGALIYVASIIDNKLKQEADSLMESSENIEISENLDARLEQLLKKARAVSAKTRRYKMIRKVSKVCAILFIGIFLFLTIAMPTEVQAFKLRLFELFTDEKVEYSVLDFGQVNADVEEIIPAEWEGYYYPGYLPSEEYKLTIAKEVGNEKIFVFSDGEDAIYFSQKNTIDMENVNETLSDNQYDNNGTFEVDQMKVYWFEKEHKYRVYWQSTTTAFYLKTTSDKSQIEKIINNLAFKK